MYYTIQQLQTHVYKLKTHTTNPQYHSPKHINYNYLTNPNYLVYHTTTCKTNENPHYLIKL